MKLPSYFRDFLANIEPSPSYKEDQASGHATLRKRLAADADFGSITSTPSSRARIRGTRRFTRARTSTSWS